MATNTISITRVGKTNPMHGCDDDDDVAVDCSLPAKKIKLEGDHLTGRADMAKQFIGNTSGYSFNPTPPDSHLSFTLSPPESHHSRSPSSSSSSSPSRTSYTPGQELPHYPQFPLGYSPNMQQFQQLHNMAFNPIFGSIPSYYNSLLLLQTMQRKFAQEQLSRDVAALHAQGAEPPAIAVARSESAANSEYVTNVFESNQLRGLKNFSEAEMHELKESHLRLDEIQRTAAKMRAEREELFEKSEIEYALKQSQQQPRVRPTIDYDSPLTQGRYKDEATMQKRHKNNEAAKKSREIKRAKNELNARRAQFLEKENQRLHHLICQSNVEITKYMKILDASNYPSIGLQR